MAFLSNDQILGSIIPDVLISKITLETSNIGKFSVSENPHIDNNNIPNLIPDNLTGKLSNPKLSADLTKKNSPQTDPDFLKKKNKNFNSYVREYQSGKLIVTLDLILKEKFDNDLIGSWSSNQDFTKYLRVKILQCTNQTLTIEASKNKLLLSVYDKNKSLPLSKKFVDDKISYLISKLNLDNSKNIFKVLDESVNVQTLNIKDDLNTNTSNLNNKYRETDTDGNTIISFTFRSRFELNNKNPDHLSYFVFSYIDLDQLVKDFNMTIDHNFTSEMYGKVVSDIVIDNSDVVSKSFVYTKGDGSIWTGAIEETLGSGSFGILNNNKFPINKITVSNSKVQDFRIVNDLKKQILDFTNVQKEILSNKIYGVDNNKLDIIVPENTFSDIFLSRDENGNSRFIFSINFRKLLETNGVFGKIFKNYDLAKFVLKDSFILSMRLLRRRIKGSPEIGSPPDITKKFNTNYPDEIIAVSGERSFNDFVEISNVNISLREVKNIFNDTNKDLALGIRYFTGIDKSMNSNTDGYYVYGIELDVEDSSYNFLIKKVLELQNAKQKLQNYLNESLQNTYTRAVVLDDNPYIDDTGHDVVKKYNVSVGNYNPYINRFSHQFIESQRVKYKIGTSNEIVTPWVEAIETYLDNLILFSTNIDKNLFLKWKQELLFFVHPVTGNPSGILEVIKLIEIFEKNIARLLGIDSVVIPSYSSNSAESPSRLGLKPSIISQDTKVAFKQKLTLKSFKVVNFFKNYFNSNHDKTIGHDFLDIRSSIDNENGLKIITGEEYSTRVERETNHYFVRVDSTIPDINLRHKGQSFTNNDFIDNTSYSYLTPAFIKLKEKFNIRRIGNSPTPLINGDELAHLDLGIRNYNSYGTVDTINNGDFLSDSISFFSTMNLEPVMLDNITRIPMSNLLKYNNVRNPLPTDLLPSNDTSICNIKPSQNLALNIEGVNPLPLLLEISNRLSLFGNSSVKMSSPVKFKDKMAVKNFDIDNSNSGINLFLRNAELQSYEEFFQGSKPGSTLSDALSKLPNQVKSLYLSRTNPGIIRKNWLDKQKDSALSSHENTEFRLSYGVINTVQILKGFDKSIDNEILLKKPIWEPLTLNAYNNSIGEAILCRIKPYENSAIGLYQNKALDLPPFHEYFFIVPKKKTVVDVVAVESNAAFKITIHSDNISLMSISTELLTNNIVNNNIEITPTT